MRGDSPCDSTRRRAHSRVALRYAYIFVVVCVAACTADPGYRGKSSKAMMDELQGGNREARIDAAFGLKKVLEIRPDYPEVVAALSHALRDTSDAVRMAAAHAFTVPGVNVEPALEGIRAALRDSAHANTRQMTAMTIGTLGPSRAAPLVPELLEALSDENSEVREAAVESLGMLGPAAGGGVEAIAARSMDPSGSVRRAVFQALINLRARPEAVLALTRRAASDTSADVREAAVLLLGTFGPNASPALSELEGALADEDARVVLAALYAIEAMGVLASRTQPRLEILNDDSSPTISSAAARALSSVKGRPLPLPAYEEPLKR